MYSYFAFAFAAEAMHPRLKAWTAANGHTASIYSLTPHMILGSKGMRRPCIDAKTAETKTLFFFAVSELRHFRPKLLAHSAPVAQQAKLLLEAGQRLVDIYKACTDHPRKLPKRVCTKLLADARSHNALMSACGCQLVPKHHWFWEIIRDAPRCGNPMRYTNYADEDFNRIISSIAARVHGRTFAISVLQHYRIYCIAVGMQY